MSVTSAPTPPGRALARGATPAVLCLAAALLAAGLALALSHPSTPRSTPRRADLRGLHLTSLGVTIDARGGRGTTQRLLASDVRAASSIPGLRACRVARVEVSSFPAPPMLACRLRGAIPAASLVRLEQLPGVESVFGRGRRRSESLYFLGVVRGEPALIVQPIGGGARALGDLRALQRLPGVLGCSWSGPEPGLPGGAGGTIACAMASRHAATVARSVAYRLDVAYAEVFASW